MTIDYEIFELGDLALQRGATLRNARLAYKTFGTLNAARDNAIVYPTWYSGQHYDNEWLVGRGMALDPDKYFIIIPNMFGNGLSSSPSNTPEPYNASRFPRVTAYDNVRAQAYPPMLVTAGLNDPRVTYWEPAKWVARLRELKTDDNELLLKTNMGAGHGGKSGRFESLRETAEEFAFILWQMAVGPAPSSSGAADRPG